MVSSLILAPAQLVQREDLRARPHFLSGAGPGFAYLANRTSPISATGVSVGSGGVPGAPACLPRPFLHALS